jgi:cytoskeleton protein RodZ
MPIGETLAEARRARGLSVEDVAAQTRIRGTVIRSIEADRFDICGAAVYARGHIRSIARVVGGDPEPLVAEYDQSNGGPPGGPAPLAVTPFDPKAEEASRRRRPNWAAAAAVSLLVIIGFAAAALVTGNRQGPSNAGAVRASAPASPSPSAQPTPAAKPATPPPSAVAAAGVTVVVKVLSADSWCSVKNAAGNIIFQGLIYAGQQMTFTDPTLLSLVIGNAPVVDLVVNGHDIGSPSGPGNVARVSYGPGNPSASAGAA